MTMKKKKILQENYKKFHQLKVLKANKISHEFIAATSTCRKATHNSAKAKFNIGTAQAPGISDHTGGLLHHLLPGHVELELHVYLTGGDECMHTRLLGILHRLPSPINIPLIAPGKATYDRNVFALPIPNLLRNQSDGLEIGLRGSREPRLNDIHTELRQLPRHVELLFGGHCGAGGLLAVPESSVENSHIVRIRDPVRDVIRPPWSQAAAYHAGGVGEGITRCCAAAERAVSSLQETTASNNVSANERAFAFVALKHSVRVRV
nr:hypothetical protein L484_024706 [Ipomoea batatas]